MKPVNDRLQFWQNHLQHYQASGLSGMQYCEQEQLAYHCFIYWRRKFTAMEGVVPREPARLAKSKTGFVGVGLPTPTGSVTDEALELALPNGLVIGNIHSGNLELVGRLLESL